MPKSLRNASADMRIRRPLDILVNEVDQLSRQTLPASVTDFKLDTTRAFSLAINHFLLFVMYPSFDVSNPNANLLSILNQGQILLLLKFHAL